MVWVPTFATLGLHARDFCTSVRISRCNVDELGRISDDAPRATGAIPTRATPSRPGAARFVVVFVIAPDGTAAVVERNSGALLENGTVHCWGANNGDSVPQPGSSAIALDVSDATAISTGGLNTCAILKNKSVRCWGAVNSNLSDHGKANDEALANLSDVTQISAGGQHICALSADKSLRCWGLGGQGQINGQLPEGCTSLEDACFLGVTAVH
jgi:hypothetical protein